MTILKRWGTVAALLSLQLPAYAGMACDYRGGSCGGGKAVVLLLALAVGYGVLVLAQNQSRSLKKLGQVIGWIVLVVSFVGLLCVATCGFKGMCRYKAVCPVGMDKMDMGSAPAAPEPPQSK